MNYDALLTAMADLEEDAVLELAEEAANAGKEAAEAAMNACQEAMQIIGDRFEEGEYFIGDLVFAGELMTQAMDILKPAVMTEAEGGIAATKMIMCTVKGDLHDIGKNIVRAMLEAAGFEVIDLGVDTAPGTIVEAVKTHGARIVALSGVLTLSLESMKATVEALAAAGLRPETKVIIGGNPASEEACAYTGADAWAQSPTKTIEVCRAWAE